MHKFLMLGAGPAGLAFANRLLSNGTRSFLVLEAEHEAGGLCRSSLVDGSYLDIGGGHILDVRRPEVVKFLFSFMPRDEWNPSPETPAYTSTGNISLILSRPISGSWTVSRRSHTCHQSLRLGV